MRTISQALIDSFTSSRQVAGQLTFRDPRLIFTSRTHTETISANIEDVDSSTLTDGLLRVAKKDDDTLQFIYLDDPGSVFWDAWAPVGVTVQTDSSIGLEGNRLWYIAPNKYIYYIDFTEGSETWGTATQVMDTSSWMSTKIALAPVSDTKCYVQVGPEDTPLTYAEVKAISSGGSVLTTFHGFVFGDPTQRYKFDAVTLNGVDYVFVVDRDDGRAMYTKVVDLIWSELKQVVPIDVVDDLVNFKLGGVTIIDGKIFVTGKYRRGENIEFDMYTMSDGTNFTMGRDLYIDNYFGSTDIGGKLHLWDNTVWFLGFGGVSEAPATVLVGYDNTDNKLETREFVKINSSLRGSSATTFSVDMKHDIVHDAVRQGAEITVELGYGENLAQMFMVGVDVLAPSDDEGGHSFSIGGRGLGFKKLDQWESDQSYDYWSQAKVDADPSEMSELVRTSGYWTGEAGILTNDRLNIDSYMYCTAKSSRGAAVRARFRKTAGSGYTPRYGVGVNYYKENRYDAADRLGVDVSLITDGDYGHNGIFAIADGGDLYIMRLWNNIETELDSTAFTPSDDVWHWIQLIFQDGYIRVITRNDGSTDWTEVLEYKYQANTEPWFRPNDDLGRGALYMNNVTVYGDTPGFHSDAVIIPVDDIAPFPTTETVEVDNEHIDYDGKATSSEDPGTMPWAEGYTFKDSPVQNDNWDNALLYQQPWDVGNPEEIAVGEDEDDMVYLSHSFRDGLYGHKRIDKIRIPIKKVGTPTDLWCYIVTDWWDERNPPLATDIIGATNNMHTSVTEAAVTTGYLWVDLDFTSVNEPDRWLDANDPSGSFWFVITTMPPGDVDYASYHDPSNYYVVQLNDELYEAIGINRTWDNTYKWDWYRDRHDPDAIIPFQIRGVGPLTAEGFEIYFDGVGPVVADTEFTDMALVCTAGPGEGMAEHILLYDYRAPMQWQATRTYEAPDTWQDHIGDLAHGDWVDKDLSRAFVASRPMMYGEGSEFEIWPALLVDTRGVDETIVTTHGDTRVSVWRISDLSADGFQYHSTEMDSRLVDMGAEIAGKAGVLEFSGENDLEGVQNFTGAGFSTAWVPGHRQTIVKMTIPTIGAGEELGLSFRIDDTGTPTEGYRVTIDDSDNLILYWFDSSWAVLETVPLPFSPGGVMTISVQEEHFSVWFNDRLAHVFVHTIYTDGDNIGITADGDIDVDVEVSAVDRRVDNFILDMGARGTQLFGGMIGPKRVTVMDTPTGGLRMAMLKTSGTADFEIADLVVDSGHSEQDNAHKSVIRAEGAEAVEIIDYDHIAEFGFLFNVVNAPEANDAWETKQEADAALLDLKSSARQVDLSGALDMRIEPNDIIDVWLDDVLETIIVDGANIMLSISPTDAVLDMTVKGRYAI
jgi:hypothetical protein